MDAMGLEFKLSGFLVLMLINIPYLVGLGVVAWLKEDKSIWLMGSVLILLTLIGTYMLYSALVLHLDAQSGLVFFVVPVYTFPVVLITAVIAFVIGRKA